MVVSSFRQQILPILQAIYSFLLSLPSQSVKSIREFTPRTFRQALSVMLCLVIVANQIVAAPLLIAATGIANNYRHNLSFWFYAGGWAKMLQQGGKAADPQETQDERNARVVQIEVSPEDAEIHAGETIVFSASAYDSHKDAVGGVKFTWSLVNEKTQREFTLPPDGKFTPYLAGKYRVVASALNHKGQTKLTVTGTDPRRQSNAPIGEPIIVTTKDDLLSNKIGQRLSPQFRATGEQQAESLLANERKIDLQGKQRKGLRASAKALGAAKAMNYPTSCGDQNGWNDCNYSSADDCGRERGDMPGRAPDAEAGSGNFQFSAPVVGMNGRGLDVNLNLVYNSRVWHKPTETSLEITYDIDKDWPAPGWTVGFGKLISMGPNAGVMMVEADGTRHGFRAAVSNLPGNQKKVDAKTSDGTFIDYSATCDANANGMIPRSGSAKLANGTIITYGAPGNKAVYPTQILDPNGNYISITYANNTGPKIDTVTDTLGRQVKFYYDVNGCLTTITGPGFNAGTRELVRLHYRQITINPTFASGMFSHVTTPTVWVVDAIYYPSTATGYWFGDGNTGNPSYGSYSTYGMLFKISEQRGMTFSSTGYTDMGTVGAGTMSRQMSYDYTQGPDVTLTDMPKYTQMKETWAGVEPSAPNLTLDPVTSQWCAITAYSVNGNYYDSDVSTYVERIVVTKPDTTKSVQYSYKIPGDFRDGLIYKDETQNAAGSILYKSKVAWEYDTTACPNSTTFEYCAPRSQRTEITDDRGQLTATNYTYSTDATLRRYNPLIQTDELDYGGTVPIRQNRVQYVTNSNYIARHIFKLPSATEVYTANGTTRLARTEYYYDEFQGTNGLTNTSGVVQHAWGFDPYLPPGSCSTQPDMNDPDCQLPDPSYCVIGDGSGCDQYCPQITVCTYDPSTEYRGNVTTVKRFADAVNLTVSTAVIETRRYDICGNTVKVQPSCCQYVNTTYDINTQFAYPITESRGADTSSGPQNITSATYNFNWGLVLSATDANGRVTSQAYYTATLRPQYLYEPTGGTSQTVYDDVAMKVTQTSYLGGVGSTTVAKNERYLDGLGRVTKEMALGAGTDQDFVETKYDGMARVWKQSRPYRSPDTPVYFVSLYDELGRTTTVTSPDGSTGKAYYNQKYPNNSNAPYPAGATAGAAGQTILVLDQWGRERWSRRDSLGRMVEIIEPDPSATPTANPGDQIANNGYCTKYAYNELDQLTDVYQGVTTALPTGVQQRKFKYDALSRLTNQRLAERDATLNDSGSFVATYNSGTKHWTGGNWSDYFQYDTRSNLICRTDARGVKTNYNYGGDVLNRLQGITYDTTSVPAAVTSQNAIIAAASISYAYVSSGDLTRLQQVTDGMGTDAFSYDTEGRLAQRIRTFPGRSGLQLDVLYDAMDRVQDVTYPAEYGVGINPRPVLHHNYDSASRISSMTVDGASFASSLLYNAASQTTYLNVGGTTNQLSENYTYDPLNGLLAGQTVQRTGVGTILNLSYDYSRSGTTGKTGQLTKITNSDTSKNRSYDYDGLGRLKTAQGGLNGVLWTQTYTYDRLGNRSSVVATGNAAGSGGAIPVDGLPTTANYESASNRLTSVATNASFNPANPNFDYDPTGNQTRVIQSTGVAQRYVYDAAGRLAQIKADDNTTMIASYGYGATNQRLKQTEYVSGVGTTTCYAWSGGSIIGEYLDNGSALVWQKNYIHLGGRLLATQVPGSAASATQYHHPDRLGSRLITNAGDTGFSENSMLPYGTAIDAESAGTTTNRRFTSYDRSNVTKLDYAVNRFYDSKQGRFTQVDPIGMSAASLGDPQSLNLYAYVGNDPINRTDPDGLFWKKLFGWIGKVLKAVAIAVFVAGAILLTAGLATAAIAGWAASSPFFEAFGALMGFFMKHKIIANILGIGTVGGFRTPGINGSSTGFINSFQGGSCGSLVNPCPTDTIVMDTVPAYSSYWEYLKAIANPKRINYVKAGIGAINVFLGVRDTVRGVPGLIKTVPIAVAGVAAAPESGGISLVLTLPATINAKAAIGGPFRIRRGVKQLGEAWGDPSRGEWQNILGLLPFGDKFDDPGELGTSLNRIRRLPWWRKIGESLSW